MFCGGMCWWIWRVSLIIDVYHIGSCKRINGVGIRGGVTAFCFGGTCCSGVMYSRREFSHEMNSRWCYRVLINRGQTRLFPAFVVVLCRVFLLLPLTLGSSTKDFSVKLQ